jgi:hypothetical protein
MHVALVALGLRVPERAACGRAVAPLLTYYVFIDSYTA